MATATEGPPFSAADEELFWNSSARWSISKRMTSLSCQEFKGLAKTFQAAAARVFGTPVTLEVTALSSIPFSSTMGADPVEEEFMKRDRAEHTLLQTGDLNALTDSLWAKSATVEVSISPVDASKAPKYASAFISRDFNKPRDASFFIQTNQTDVRSAKQAVTDKRPRFSIVKAG